MYDPLIFLPVSCNGSGDGKTEWAVSLATSFNGRHVQIENMGGSHADRQCNNMANRFLQVTEKPDDLMLIIDIDTGDWHEKEIARAVGHMERGHKAIWGTYPKKQDSTPPCVNTWPHHDTLTPDEFGLMNVRRAGRGFLMIKREVFEALKEDNGGPAKRFHNHGKTEWAFFRSGRVTGDYSAVLPGEDENGYDLAEWISEDWMLCEDLRLLLGIPTLVDTGIVLSHVGSKTYRFPQELLVRTDSNISSWRDIHGWFDYEDLYRMIAAEIPDGGYFAEVGCWLGRSTAAFSEFAKEAGKRPFIWTVDTFQGNPANEAHRAILSAHGGNVEKVFRANMEALKVPRLFTYAEDSAEGAGHFGEGNFDAVFIDADHSEEAVTRDIAAWLPKVKRGGLLAGHDFDEPGVAAAVAKAGLPVEAMGRCWVYRKT